MATKCRFCVMDDTLFIDHPHLVNYLSTFFCQKLFYLHKSSIQATMLWITSAEFAPWMVRLCSATRHSSLPNTFLCQKPLFLSLLYIPLFLLPNILTTHRRINPTSNIKLTIHLHIPRLRHTN